MQRRTLQELYHQFKPPFGTRMLASVSQRFPIKLERDILSHGIYYEAPSNTRDLGKL